MSPGGRKRGSCTSTIGTGTSYAAAARSIPARSVSPHVRSVSLSSQVPITLLRNRTVPSTPPSLVRLAARASSVSTGASSSRPARAQVPRETYAASSVCIGTPTTADAVSCEPTATTGTTPPTCSATWGSRSPTSSTGVDEVGEERRVEAEADHQLGVPGAGGDVEQPGGGGVGALGDVVAGQGGSDQVGDQQDRVGLGQAAVGGELVERVEGQVLQAVAPVELLRADQVGDGGRTLRRPPLVAVVERLPEEPAVAQPAVVDGPGVDADRGERPLGVRRGQAGDRVVDQRRDVPVQAVLGAHRFVGEPRGGGQPQRVGTHLADHHPAAGGAQVDGREPHRRNAAATPESTGMCRPVVRESSGEQSTNTAWAQCSGSTSCLSRVRWA